MTNKQIYTILTTILDGEIKDDYYRHLLKKVTSAIKQDNLLPEHEQDFFKVEFDVLPEEKEQALIKEVDALHKGKTRPYDGIEWSRDEQALLMETICYTNNADKLYDIFGRYVGDIHNVANKMLYLAKQRDNV